MDTKVNLYIYRKRYLNAITRDKSFKIKNEITDCYERYLMNKDKDKFYSELKEKNITIPEVHIQMPNYKFTYEINRDLIISSDEVTLRFKMTKRMRELLKMHTKEYFINAYLNYLTILANKQQWACVNMPFKKANIKIECFASCFNTILKQQYFSLFWKDEIKYGAIGDFFKDDPCKYKGNIMCNPPFIEKMLNDAADRILWILSKCKKSIVFISPLWKDLYAIDILRKSKHYMGERILKPDEHVYKDLSEKNNATRSTSIFIILSSTNDIEFKSIIMNAKFM